MLLEGIEFKVCWMILDDDSCPTLEFLATLRSNDPKAFAKSVAGIQQLADGRRHRYPHSLALQGAAKGVFELRLIGGKQRHYLRFPFVTMGREVIILFGEVKKRASPTTSFINQAHQYGQMCLKKEASYEQIPFDDIEI